MKSFKKMLIGVRIEYSRLLIKIIRIIAIIIFIVLTIYFSGLFCISYFYSIKTFGDWVNWLFAFFTFYLATTTVLVIWWQGRQIKRQLELQVITDLYREWNSDEMMKARSDLCSILYSDRTVIDNSCHGLDKIEEVLEFFEKIASYHLNGVLTRSLIWDTFSFYIMRYYFYTKDAVKYIEKKWDDDPTLYYDLNKLYNILMKEECRRRWLSRERVEEGLSKGIEQFKRSEHYGISRIENSKITH